MLWRLDRETFGQITSAASEKYRRTLKEFLAKATRRLRLCCGSVLLRLGSGGANRPRHKDPDILYLYFNIWRMREYTNVTCTGSFTVVSKPTSTSKYWYLLCRIFYIHKLRTSAPLQTRNVRKIDISSSKMLTNVGQMLRNLSNVANARGPDP